MNLSRRDVLLALAASPLAGMALPAWGDEEQKHTFSLAQDALIIDGKPRFLIGGSIDYFRCPNELWRDRLLRCKRAGLNSIATYVAWNYHEQEEGVFNFSGDRDLPRYLDICNELGLLVFLRVGPFICGEWEAGGYPAWLIGREDVQTRSNHAPTLAAVRRWLGELIPRVAPKQITRGGAVVLVQQENEYFFTGRPGAAEYQDFLIHTMKEFGIDVPISDCNGESKEIRRPESLSTHNGWHPTIVPRLRRSQPGKPVIISEFYTHWIECWGEEEHNIPAVELVQQQSFECLSAGAMPFYYMFHGGTNFGFDASRSGPTDGSFVTSRYFRRGPVTEGGALTDMYFALKAALQPAASLEDLLAGSRGAKLPVTLEGPVRGVARTGRRGSLLFLSDNSPTDQTAPGPCAFTLPGGLHVELAFKLSSPAILPLNVQATNALKIDFSNAALVAISPDAIVISGDEGRAGIISVNGQIAEFTFGADAQILKPGGAVVLAVPTAIAARTWLADGRVIIGPAYVGEKRGDRHECWCDDDTPSVRALDAGGVLQTTPVTASAPAGPQELRLTDWKSSGFSELQSGAPEKAGDWRELGGPTHVENLDAYLGYSWYRASYHCDRARASSLLFTDAADRIHVFHNGQRIGLFGRGPEVSRDPLPVQLAAGDNRFVFLCDNMGRSSEGACIDRKGIGGSVHVDASESLIHWTQQSAPGAPPTTSWRFQTYQARNKFMGFSRATGEFTAAAGRKLVVRIRDMTQFAWISLNGKLLGEHGGDLTLIDGAMFSTFVVDPLPAGGATLEIVTTGEPVANLTGHVRVFGAPSGEVLAGWGFRPWSAPTNKVAAPADFPVLWRTQFSRPALAGPIFFDPGKLAKGHVFLNGRAVARYWQIGPQKTVYLPEPWFADRNELVVFDEMGRNPTDTRLIRDARYPTRMVLA